MAEDFEHRLRPLWSRAQAGDEVAYRQALRLMAERLRGFFGRRLFGYAQDVEDLVQETLLALHLQRGTHDAASPVTAWLYGIARHKLVDFWRRRGRSERLFEPADELDDAWHPVTTEETTARRDLAVLLEQLPAAQRQSILDTKVEGLSVADAAARAGISESSVKVNVHRGMKRLARMIRGTP